MWCSAQLVYCDLNFNLPNLHWFNLVLVCLLLFHLLLFRLLKAHLVLFCLLINIRILRLD